MNTTSFIAGMPKTELHVHLEGCLEPTMLLRLAAENDVDIGMATEAEIWAAQDYPDPALPHFLDYHYKCLQVMAKPQDFYDVTYAFIETCRDNNVRHVEIMFGPMAHLERGISFADQFEEMERARSDGHRDFGVSVLWIMCIDREHDPAEALEMLDLAEPYRDAITGLGMASYEKDNPPNKFLTAYQLAKERGYRLTAHCDCDQDNSTEHIRQCLDELGVERIDHGLHVLDDPALIEQVLRDRVALTMCPTWRPRDPEPRRMGPVKRMLDLGINVSLNTDDPSEFASRHMTHMMAEVLTRSEMGNDDMVAFMRNAFEAAWISNEQRAEYLSELEAYASS
ncbi:MAG: adenosine deaminase [Acidimicrobiaceae bacterium]|jgi:adenine deaminase|nr:adenosine deaminase [Acidimicrobiaceae bacterium]MCO4836049.1 adenosine deaminase [Acidimicrobiaceae bacterium]MDC1388675.1 adenosine deaminase [Acidimicrobiales bacterium]